MDPNNVSYTGSNHKTKVKFEGRTLYNLKQCIGIEERTGVHVTRWYSGSINFSDKSSLDILELVIV